MDLKPGDRSVLADRPPTQSTRPACLVCDARLAASMLPGLLKCPECGFVTADFDLDNDALAALYGRTYFEGEEYGDYAAEAESLKANFRRRLRTLLRHVPHAEARTLFEIGCAYGYFLDVARDEFARVAGIDISADAVARASSRPGLHVTCGDYLTDAASAGPHDVYCMWDTIEHLKRPDLYIEKIASNIAPGGVLAITTGDIGSFNARIRGAKWRMIHPPTHLHYFSRETLTRLLVRFGFEVLHVEHPATVRTLDAILYGLIALRSGKQDIYRRLSRVVPGGLGIRLNLFDIMYVVARKA